MQNYIKLGKKTTEVPWPLWTYSTSPSLTWPCIRPPTSKFAPLPYCFAHTSAPHPSKTHFEDIYQSAPLVAGTPFNLIAASIPSGLIVQYGFMVYGLNANPADESALGSVVVSGLTAPLNITNNSLLAHLEQNAVKLNWETSNDESIENFLIEKIKIST